VAVENIEDVRAYYVVELRFCSQIHNILCCYNREGHSWVFFGKHFKSTSPLFLFPRANKSMKLQLTYITSLTLNLY